MQCDIIPAIDIMDGTCVRLSEGAFSTRRTYSAGPLDTARQFEALGARRLHLVDLDGARCGKPVNIRTLETIASGTDLIIDYGGGIQGNGDISAAFDAGAAMVVAGTAAALDPPLFRQWLRQYTPEKIILGADFRDGSIAVKGWTEYTDLDPAVFIRGFLADGLRTVICTDISRDGMFRGPALEQYRSLCCAFPELRIIASGGVSSAADILAAAAAGCSGVIAGKALYENRISNKELQTLLPGVQSC